MKSKMDIGNKNLRDFVTGSLDTMNLIVLLGMACREGGALFPVLKPAVCLGPRAHGKGKRGHFV